METFALIVSIITLILAVYIISLLSKEKQIDSAPEQISKEVLLGLFKEMNAWQSMQTQQISEGNSRLSMVIEQNINELRMKILENLGNQTQTTQSIIQDKLDKTSTSLLLTTKNELSKISTSTYEQLEIINSQVQKRLDENFARNLKSFEEVSKNLGAMEQKAQSMIEATKSIDKLNSVFGRTSSKAFGTFSEDYLESLLAKYLLKNSWQKQVKVPGSNDMIDFVIYLEDKKIGIDSKFPLTKYQDYLEALEVVEKKQKKTEYLREVLRMAKEISSKYYHNSFVDTLMLYLPSDSMYIECMEDQDILDKIHECRVTIVSPHALFAQLGIIFAYQSKIQITEGAEAIIAGLKQISRNLGSFKDEYRKLGDKLRQAQANYDLANSSLVGVEREILLLDGR